MDPETLFLDQAVEMNVEFRDDQIAQEDPTIQRADPDAPQARVAEGRIHENARRIRIKDKEKGTLTSFDFGAGWVKVFRLSDNELLEERPISQADKDRVKAIRIVS